MNPDFRSQRTPWGGIYENSVPSGLHPGLVIAKPEIIHHSPSNDFGGIGFIYNDFLKKSTFVYISESAPAVYGDHANRVHYTYNRKSLKETMAISLVIAIAMVLIGIATWKILNITKRRSSIISVRFSQESLPLYSLYTDLPNNENVPVKCHNKVTCSAI